MGVWEEVVLPWGSVGRECFKTSPNNKSLVGTYSSGPGVYSGFVRSKKKFEVIEYPKAPSTTARGINKSGVIVGAFEDAGRAWHGFMRDSKGVYMPYEVKDPASPPKYLPISRGNAAFGLNAKGTVVGVYSDANNKEYGYVSSNGRTDIGAGCESIRYPDSPGAVVIKTRVFQINSEDAIVGRYEVAGDGHGFVGLLRKGKYELFPIELYGFIPGAANISVSGINDGYDIVGAYSLNGISHGFRWKIDKATGKTDGVPTPNVDYPGTQGSFVTSIADNGSFTGYFTDASNLRHAFRFE